MYSLYLYGVPTFFHIQCLSTTFTFAHLSNPKSNAYLPTFSVSYYLFITNFRMFEKLLLASLMKLL